MYCWGSLFWEPLRSLWTLRLYSWTFLYFGSSVSFKYWQAIILMLSVQNIRAGLFSTCRLGSQNHFQRRNSMDQTFYGLWNHHVIFKSLQLAKVIVHTEKLMVDNFNSASFERRLIVAIAKNHKSYAFYLQKVMGLKPRKFGRQIRFSRTKGFRLN